MFKWFRKKNDDPESQALNNEALETEELSSDSPEAAAEETVSEIPKDAAAEEVVDETPEEPAAEEIAEEAEESVAAEEISADAPEDVAVEKTAADAEEVEAGPPEDIEAGDSEAVETEAKPEAKRPGFFARLFGEKKGGDEPEEGDSEAAAAEEPEAVIPEDVVTEEIADDSPEVVAVEEAADESPEVVAVEEIAIETPEEVEIEDHADEPAALAAAGEAEAAETGKGEGAETFPSEGAEDDEASSRKGIFAKFKDRLSATRDKLAGRIENLLASVRAIDDDVLDELEELLITADLGAQTTSDLLFKIRGQVASNELSDAEALKDALKKRISEMMDVPLKPLPKTTPVVVMVVGINGVGKTTTIAKLTKRLQGEGKKVLLAAGDTFRSAAVEQLTIWAERLGAEIVSQPTGADPSAVVFDALNAAQARGRDVVLIDTAGRLHTKVNLMDELKKIKRVAGKAMPGAPHHTILVLDGNTGQNALRQAQTFHEAVGVDSIIMTKLDGTAKGGVIVSIANELKIPITHVGLGESFDDLQPFDPEAFTEAILSV